MRSLQPSPPPPPTLRHRGRGRGKQAPCSLSSSSSPSPSCCRLRGDLLPRLKKRRRPSPWRTRKLPRRRRGRARRLPLLRRAATATTTLLRSMSTTSTALTTTTTAERPTKSSPDPHLPRKSLARQAQPWRRACSWVSPRRAKGQKESGGEMCGACSKCSSSLVVVVGSEKRRNSLSPPFFPRSKPPQSPSVVSPLGSINSKRSNSYA